MITIQRQTPWKWLGPSSGRVFNGESVSNLIEDFRNTYHNDNDRFSIDWKWIEKQSDLTHGEVLKILNDTGGD